MRSIRDIIEAAVKASSPLVIAACGVDTTGYQQACVGVEGLNPPVIPDVIEYRSQSSALSPAQQVLQSTGTACATATDVPACQAALAGLQPDGGFGEVCTQICVSYYLATTKGNEVKAWASRAELLTFLGTIDTAEEAVLLASADGYAFRCDRLEDGAVRSRDGGFDLVGSKGLACGEGTQRTRYFLSVTPSGQVTVNRSEVAEAGTSGCAIGRRPAGLQASGVCEGEVGAYLAQVARLEAASVSAFMRLKAELHALGAPVELKGRAMLAAMEEVLHARATAELARRRGASVEPPVVEELPLRPAAEVALDNAVEGCVRETFGAVVAHLQAREATDPEVRAVMTAVAEDETRHAELSWAVARWLEPRLDAAERERVARARDAAVDGLRRELARGEVPRVAGPLGLPPPEVAQAALSALVAGLELGSGRHAMP